MTKLYLHSSLPEKENEIKIMRVAMRNLERERISLIKQSILMCVKCNQPTTIGETVYIQTQYYVPPRGCTEGDYWSDGEGQYLCPHCQYLNRLYKSPEIVEHKQHFKSILVTQNK